PPRGSPDNTLVSRRLPTQAAIRAATHDALQGEPTDAQDRLDPRRLIPDGGPRSRAGGRQVGDAQGASRVRWRQDTGARGDQRRYETLPGKGSPAEGRLDRR